MSIPLAHFLRAILREGGKNLLGSQPSAFPAQDGQEKALGAVGPKALPLSSLLGKGQGLAPDHGLGLFFPEGYGGQGLKGGVQGQQVGRDVQPGEGYCLLPGEGAIAQTHQGTEVAPAAQGLPQVVGQGAEIEAPAAFYLQAHQGERKVHELQLIDLDPSLGRLGRFPLAGQFIEPSPLELQGAKGGWPLGYSPPERGQGLLYLPLGNGGAVSPGGCPPPGIIGISAGP